MARILKEFSLGRLTELFHREKYSGYSVGFCRGSRVKKMFFREVYIYEALLGVLGIRDK